MRATRNTSPSREINAWVFALLLVLPAFVPLTAHYVGFARAGLKPTGFISYDAPYYLANAREIIDSGSWFGSYSNAFSFDYASPRIYFQPLTLVLGTLLRIPEIDGGVLFAVIGLIAAVACGRVAIALFDRYSAAEGISRTLSIVAFLWGGGFVAVTATFLFALLPGAQAGIEETSAFARWWYWTAVDPMNGWWFLNLGRNLVLPTEAVYHGLFFAAIVLILTRRLSLATVAIALLSISHPFTGIQLVAIVGMWALLELAIRSNAVPLWFLGGVTFVGVFHVAYYLVFLPSFPEHRQLQEQWTLAWSLDAVQSVVAYGLVFAFALIRMRSPERLRSVVGDSANRLLIVWVIVCLLLENHELFLAKPIQPLHFTRGYSWVALFLLGLPAIVALFERAIGRRKGAARRGFAAALLAIFVVDNAVWLIAMSARALGSEVGRDLPPGPYHLGYGLTRDQSALYAWLNGKGHAGRIVVSEDDRVGYLTTVYTPLRSWRSHYANTPWSAQRLAELRQFFDSGAVVPAWRVRPTLVVFRDSTGWRNRVRNFRADATELVFRNSSYTVISVTPAATERASSRRAKASSSADRHSPATQVDRLDSGVAR